jgi:hypothetical protein
MGHIFVSRIVCIEIKKNVKFSYFYICYGKRSKHLSREPKVFTPTGINIITLKIPQETIFFAIKFFL